MGEIVTDRLRLGFYCTGCMPGYHLPFLAAAAPGGAFAEHGLDVQILDPLRGPANTFRVAEGGADVCLTSVAYYVQARASVAGVAARFVYLIGRRFPMSGIVAADSPLREPVDLGGRRIGGSPDDRLVLEYQAALRHLGIPIGELVPVEGAEAHRALARGEIDVVPDFADLVPRVRRNSGIEVRPVRLGIELYHNGLVAADRLSDELLGRFLDAVTAALEHQRRSPVTGLDELLHRYPETDPDDALEQWELAVPTIFDGSPLGSLDAERWESTIGYLSARHGAGDLDPASAYRSVTDRLVRTR